MRYKMKRFFLITALALSFASAFAGGIKEEATTVTVWHSAEGSNTEVFEAIAQNFNETVGKERNIRIDAIYQGKANDVLTKVNAAMGTDTMPDIAMMDATAATDMNSSKALVTVDRLGIDTSDILPNAIGAYTSEKGLLAVPFNASALLYYYNKSLYDAAGVSAPLTLDDMAKAVAKTSDSQTSGFAGIPTTFELTTFIGAQKGTSYMVNNRNGHMGRPTEVLFGKEGTYRAFLEKWLKVYSTGGYSTMTSGVTGEFTSGRTAAMLASSSKLASVVEAVSGNFEVGVAKVPMVDESATGGTALSGGALYSFTDSEAVKTVLEYLISVDVQALWSEKTGYVAVNTKSYDAPSYQAFLERNPLYRVAVEALRNSSATIVNLWIPSSYSIYYAFQKNIADVLGGKDIPTAVSEMEATLQSALDTYKAQN